jgi:hypothetical protein|tara:strand:+ start:2823 stop:3170 length:348 start_codon:yes stop_codon:yes gene_type:complete
MSLVIYHKTGKSLKVICQKKFTPEDGGDEAFYKNIGARLVKQGFEQNRPIPKQIEIYQNFIDCIQKKKRYKITAQDQDYYVCCVLALWKLNVYSPCSPTDPIWIAPTRKSARKKH